MVGLNSPTQALRKRRRANWHNHELLEVNIVVGMFPSIDDVHHRDGQDMSIRSSEVTVERCLALHRGGVCRGQGNAQDRVSSKPTLVLGSV